MDNMALATLTELCMARSLTELSSQVVAAQCHSSQSLTWLEDLPQELQHQVATCLKGSLLKTYLKEYHATLYDALRGMSIHEGQRLLVECLKMDDREMEKQVKVVQHLHQCRNQFNGIIHPLGLFYNEESEMIEATPKRARIQLSEKDREMNQFYTLLGNSKLHRFGEWSLPNIPKEWNLPNQSKLFSHCTTQPQEPDHLDTAIIITAHHFAILKSAWVAHQSNKLQMTILLLFLWMKMSPHTQPSLRLEVFSMMAINLARGCMHPSLVLDCLDRMSTSSNLASDRLRCLMTRQQVCWMWGLYRQETELSHALWKTLPIASFWFKKCVLVHAHSCWNELEDALLEWSWTRQVYNQNERNHAQWQYLHQKILELDQDLLNLLDRPHLTSQLEDAIELCIGINFLYHGMLDLATRYGTQTTCLQVNRFMSSASRALSMYNHQSNLCIRVWVKASHLAARTTPDLSEWILFENSLEEDTKIHDRKADVEYTWNRCRLMFSHFILRLVAGRFHLTNEEYILKILRAYQSMSGGRHYRIVLLETYLKWWRDPSSFSEEDRSHLAVGTSLANTEQKMQDLLKLHIPRDDTDQELLQHWLQQEPKRLPDLLQFGRETWLRHPYL